MSERRKDKTSVLDLKDECVKGSGLTIQHEEIIFLTGPHVEPAAAAFHRLI